MPGLRQKRVTGAEYDSLVDEFIRALKAWRPHVLLQFEASFCVVLPWPDCPCVPMPCHAMQRHAHHAAQ